MRGLPLQSYAILVIAVVFTAASPACGSAECGDGELGEDEGCDDGNIVDGDGCSTTCTVEAICGDGNLGEGEGCDDGNELSGDGCSRACQVECGDGYVDASEECDDGNLTPGDGCDENCRSEGEPPLCGNGFVEPPETCDDGNGIGGDGCSTSCQLEPVVCPAPAATIGCGDLLTGSTAGSAASFDDPCNAGTGVWIGPELLYRFDAPADEEVVFSLSATTADLDLLVVPDSCDALACAATGTSLDPTGETTRLQAEANRSYYLFVDGADPAGGSFELRVGCEADATCGNGTLEGGEGCDDGNAANADGCNAVCLEEANAALCTSPERPLTLLRPGQPINTSVDVKLDDDSGAVTCSPAPGCSGGPDAVLELVMPIGYTDLRVTFDHGNGEHVYALLTASPTCAEVDCVDPFPATADTLTFANVSDGSTERSVYLVVEACSAADASLTTLTLEPL